MRACCVHPRTSLDVFGLTMSEEVGTGFAAENFLTDSGFDLSTIPTHFQAATRLSPPSLLHADTTTVILTIHHATCTSSQSVESGEAVEVADIAARSCCRSCTPTSSSCVKSSSELKLNEQSKVASANFVRESHGRIRSTGIVVNVVRDFRVVDDTMRDCWVVDDGVKDSRVADDFVRDDDVAVAATWMLYKTRRLTY